MREPITGAVRPGLAPSERSQSSGIPHAHAQELETSDQIQVEQCVRVTDSPIAARPTRLPPHMKTANHHLRRIDQAVMQSGEITRLESTCPMCFFQLTPKTRLAVGDTRECEEAILELAKQKRAVLQVLDRLSLGVQDSLYSLDDFIAMGHEELEKFDMRLKRHLGRTRSGWPLFRGKERMKYGFSHSDLPLLTDVYESSF